MYRLARRAVATTAEAVLGELRRALADPDRLPSLAKGVELPKRLRGTAWGFRRKHAEHGRIVAVTPERFADLCGSESAATAVFDHLVGRDIAVPGSGGKRHLQLAVQGFDRSSDRPRWVVLREPALN